MNEELINILKQIKDQWGRETVEAILIEMDSKRGGLSFRGTLKRSVIYEQANDLDGDISFYMADYGKFLDAGVKGTLSSFDSPYKFSGERDKIRKMGGALKPWADAKGLNPWALAYSIQRKGIQPRRFFDTVIENRVGQLGELITGGLTEYMNNQFSQ